MVFARVVRIGDTSVRGPGAGVARLSARGQVEPAPGHAQAYQRSPFGRSPGGADLPVRRRLSARYRPAASAHVMVVPTASARWKFDRTPQHVPLPRASRKSRNWVQLPYTSSPQTKPNPQAVGGRIRAQVDR